MRWSHTAICHQSIRADNHREAFQPPFDLSSEDVTCHIGRYGTTRHERVGLSSIVKPPQTELEEGDPLCVAGGSRWHVPLDPMFDALAKCTSAGEIRTTLKSPPIGLDGTYERILLIIDGNEFQGRLVRRALVWLVAALRLLHLFDIDLRGER
ncbi:hypothetical protein BS17DRAFT_356011 [Gyrodon lividus]|nr:hypothetical protein BS17DRAFT_356011 [Gyrodon lividus]